MPRIAATEPPEKPGIINATPIAAPRAMSVKNPTAPFLFFGGTCGSFSSVGMCVPLSSISTPFIRDFSAALRSARNDKRVALRAVSNPAPSFYPTHARQTDRLHRRLSCRSLPIFMPSIVVRHVEHCLRSCRSFLAVMSLVPCCHVERSCPPSRASPSFMPLVPCC